MSQVDEGLIHAWLDGQLPPDEAARVERLAATDPVWSAAVAEARGLMAGASRVLGALDDVPSVVRSRAARGAAIRATWWRRPMVSAAAAVVLVFGIANTLWRRAPGENIIANTSKQSAPVREAREATEAAAAPAPRMVAAPPPNAPNAPIVAPSVGAARPLGRSSVSAAGAGGAVSTQEQRVANAAGELAARGLSTGGIAPTRDAPTRDATTRDVPVRDAPLRDAGVADVAAKANAATEIDAALAGCWEPVDPTAVTGAVARERADARASSAQFVLRFTGPSVTDVVRSAAPLAQPPTASGFARLAPVARTQMAVARKMNDSAYVTEWFSNDARVLLTFTVHGDTLRGTTAPAPKDATQTPSPFMAIRRACVR